MQKRPRRNRKSAAIRNMVQENHVTIHDLVYPLFLTDGRDIKDEVTSLPGNYRWSPDRILLEIEECLELGLSTFMIFPKIAQSHKDELATYSYDENNYYLKTAIEIKKRFPEACLISDIAMDPYSTMGHDGIVQNGKILNDETLAVLNKMALAQAVAGFDILGPSDMMDGRIGSIRDTLDHNGYPDVSIMSYTAKYASAFYGPFRDALDSAPVDSVDIPKDKKTYQMNPANKMEALIEADLDTDEGADFLMVKPAIHYMDIIHLLKDNYDLPIAAYQVSGECAMLIAAAEKGWLDYNKAMPETLLSLKRAGSDIIITYFAKDYATMLKNGQV